MKIFQITKTNKILLKFFFNYRLENRKTNERDFRKSENLLRFNSSLAS